MVATEMHVTPSTQKFKDWMILNWRLLIFGQSVLGSNSLILNKNLALSFCFNSCHFWRTVLALSTLHNAKFIIIYPIRHALRIIIIQQFDKGELEVECQVWRARNKLFSWPFQPTKFCSSGKRVSKIWKSPDKFALVASRFAISSVGGFTRKMLGPSCEVRC